MGMVIALAVLPWVVLFAVLAAALPIPNEEPTAAELRDPEWRRQHHLALKRGGHL